tara:strand:- start:34 stop:435 length:402 start_codon:yes stop_codon:yes gene_type:complete
MKNKYLSAFNSQLNELLEEILKIFPGHIDIIDLKNKLITVRRLNPSIIIKLWHKYIYVPYFDIIEKGDFNYFFTKDYSHDIRYLDDSKQKRIINSINAIKGPIQEMDENNKEISMLYVSNISKLSHLYDECLN